MGKIVSNFFISLDGVVEAPHEWHFPYFDDAMGAAISAGTESCAAFLLGRTLYQEWAQYWPGQPAEEPFAEFINTVPKYVLSHSLTEATWNNTTIIPGDGAAAAIQQLKDRTDGDISMSGSASTVRWLLANGLLDELNLLIHPIAVGKGARLFEEGASHRLQVLRSATFATGVLHVVYAPA